MTAEWLIREARQFYPSLSKFPPEKDFPVIIPPGQEGHADFKLPFQKTPEFQRWHDAWTQAVKETEPWRVLLSGLRPRFPALQFGFYTPAYMSGGYACILYLHRPRTDGREGFRFIRVAVAISLLAPLYFVYGTIQVATPIPSEERTPWKRHDPPERFSAPELILQPTEEMQPYADVLSRHVEHTLDYRPFPLELADVPVPDIRVPYLNGEQATLMNAFFLRDITGLS
jgi:hypothetical protein